MAVYTGTGYAFSNPITVTEFRAFFLFISNSLTSAGLLKTSDTGQIDLATVALPAQNGYAGYETRQMNNGLVLKLWYGRGGNANMYKLGFELATGTNGAGTLTGQIGSIRACEPNAAGTASAASTTLTVNVAASMDYVVISSWAVAAGVIVTSSGTLMVVERSADLNGTYNNDGANFYINTSSGAVASGYLPKSGVGVPSAETTPPFIPPTAQTTGLKANGNAGLYPCTIYGVGETRPPMKNLIGGFVSQFGTDGLVYACSIRTVSQQMQKLPMTAFATTLITRGSSPANTVFGMLARYE